MGQGHLGTEIEIGDKGINESIEMCNTFRYFLCARNLTDMKMQSLSIELLAFHANSKLLCDTELSM